MRTVLVISISFIIMFALSSLRAYSTENDIAYFNEIKKENIYTVQMHPVGWELSAPIIELKSDNYLVFSFDEIEAEFQDYSYRVVHCTKDWHSSGLSEFDYMEGFIENQIQDYEHSFNTNVNYVHYSLQIPNDDISLKLSGNYVLEVYEDFDPEKTIIRQRFMILEPKVTIRGEVKLPIAIDKRDTHQEVDFSILHPSFPINNPHSDLHVVVAQNNRWDGSERVLKPLFIRKNELVFDYESENVFPGGNEFRYFNLKSLRYQTRYIREIRRDNGQTHVLLSPGDNRHFQQYIFEQDINGQFVIDVQERDMPATEADYAYVTFWFPFDAELKHGDFFVHGKFCNWQFSDRNKMEYDYVNKLYRATIFLKQGYYSYLFVLLEHNDKTPNLGYFEGNHWEAENNYMIYVYYHDIALNYDMLIGYAKINSTENL